MMVLVCYDVETSSDGGSRRLRRVARHCQNYGERVQNSVFECLLDPAQWVRFKAGLEREADLEKDSLRYYFLGKTWRKRIEHVGAKPTLDPEAPLIL